MLTASARKVVREPPEVKSWIIQPYPYPQTLPLSLSLTLTLTRYDVLRRTPWFPVWWFDDLVLRGYLVDERADSPERQSRYRVT